MNENIVEQAALGWFEALGYHTARGAEISPGADNPLRERYEDVVLVPRLKAALRKLNPDLPEEALLQAATTVSRPPEPTLEQNNRWFHGLLTDGVSVEYRTPDGETRGSKAKLLDCNNLSANDFLVIRQLTIKNSESMRRPDLVVFLNGLPVAVIELKDPSSEDAALWTAYDQIQDYKAIIPALFVFNEILVISDGDQSRVGSLTADQDRFTPWRSIKDNRSPGEPTLENVITGLFRPDALTDYLTNCIVFEEDERTGRIVKKIGGYHQFRAVRRTRERIKLALKPNGDGRGGVVWHTQGSGKSLTMLMLSGALVGDERLKNPTIIVVTDRNDLDGQLLGTFADGRALLRQAPEQAESREDLAARLNRASGGVIFTTIQKFEERAEAISERSNIIVLADEAHRSQYGFLKGGARWMRENLPNATFVGFTGTPVEGDDRSTRGVFGEDVDIYDIKQAIDDNATVPIFYEMQLIKLLPDEGGISEAERLIAEAAETDEVGSLEDPDITVPLEELAGSKERLETLANQIVTHFEGRSEVIDGKAMIVCMSRDICMDLYDAIISLRPNWHADEDELGSIKVVMDANVGRKRPDESEQAYAARSERTKKHGRTKARRGKLANRLKDNADPLKLVIVCDMWLTGFDCPSLHTMYLDKPLAGHNLMQAIARVNRVFGDKPGGVVVDYLGIADQLRDAIQTYTQAGGEGKPVERIQDEAVPVMQRHAEELAGFFNGFDYAKLIRGSEAEQLRAIVDGANYVLAQENGKGRFMNMVALLSRAFALAVPRPETYAVRDHLSFYQNVRASIRKRLDDGASKRRVGSSSAVRQVISGAIRADGIIDLFEVAGLPETNVGILSDAFLDRLAALPQKNLALETLKKLLSDQIKSRERLNIIQSRTFRESLENVLTRYSNRAISTAQVIEELIGLAKSIKSAIEQGHETGLSEEEVAFYQALSDNESAREVLKDETLRRIARELADSIKRKATLDWTQRDAVRADMRRTVRRLLTKYGYPPDAQETATQLVIRQAELIAESAV
ncbi:type I restriction endonuclease subunit R [Bradyrhizobium guangdongense]|uniref:type I restriction endonuclease subunit R n=1 Tax=Bradyrhizobium guangdongense TaxID=1325090 RepID=UPI0011287923|nr:type I restriction endonuclease subunit R [Bradyrhizobium guangdongense]TPQ32796.1 type I restriction endonuclease subunit R [Bradyrhizobium guangdongense]